MPKTILLQTVVIKLVRKSDHNTSGLCSKPCNIKAELPMPIIRKVGKAIPSVLRVRMVLIACGR